MIVSKYNKNNSNHNKICPDLKSEHTIKKDVDSNNFILSFNKIAAVSSLKGTDNVDLELEMDALDEYLISNESKRSNDI